MVSILQQLGYLTSSFDEAEQNLFTEAWDLITHNNWTTLQNLTAFLVAIDKIYIKEQQKISKETLYERRKFGAMTNDGIFFTVDEQDVNRIYNHFALLNKNKQLLNEQLRLA